MWTYGWSEPSQTKALNGSLEWLIRERLVYPHWKPSSDAH